MKTYTFTATYLPADQTTPGYGKDVTTEDILGPLWGAEVKGYHTATQRAELRSYLALRGEGTWRAEVQINVVLAEGSTEGGAK